MKSSINELFHAFITLFGAVITLLVIIFFKNQISFGGRVVGFPVLYTGIGVIIWSGYYLKSSIMGLINPTSEELIINGPYKVIRHPVYVGTTVAMIGAGLAAKSLYGLICILVLLLPIEILRAKLEEKELLKKFGDKWIDYKMSTGFFFPKLG